MEKQSLKSKIRSSCFIGIDEVGRGPLAGPITVCAVYMEDRKTVIQELFLGKIRDSKKINKSLRNNIYITIRKNRYNSTLLQYAVSSRAAAYIDRYGISKAASECVRSCLGQLRRKGIPVEESEINLDAGLYAPKEMNKQKRYVKGDERFVEIALASIIAKEARDEYMDKLHLSHPEYSWNKNAGYGTLQHREAIIEKGITKYHRKTYIKAFKQLDNLE